MSEKKRCQICEMQPATHKFNVTKNGEKQELHLCEDCARFKGLIKSDSDEESNLAAFFKKASSNILGEDPDDNKNAKELECSTCHLTLSQFQKNGVMGCSECYTVFQDELGELLKRIHGSNKHIGSRPRPLRVIANAPDLAALKKELHEAIGQENYERAADYRDLIRDLESEENRKEG